MTASTSDEWDRYPEQPELPDPFTFSDGSRVETREGWEDRRREIKRLIQECAHGTLPPSGGPVRSEEISSTAHDVLPAMETQRRLLAGPGETVPIHLILTLPDGPGPFPAVVVGDRCWGRVAPEIVAEAIGRGYLVAEFDRTELAADDKEIRTGLHSAYPDGDFGALAAWAWGYHRVLDHLLELPEVDPRWIVVTGHSRGGKAALLAGALDERVALTAPNNSGCMGAGCTRFPHEGETLERIVRVFPHWFSPRLAEFIGRENRLPFDQHTVKALVAPRALLSTEAHADPWANPPGTQLTHQAAKVVYDFLDAGDKIGIVFRSGGHAHNLLDWRALLDFADGRLLGKEKARSFDERPYPDETETAFSWIAPRAVH